MISFDNVRFSYDGTFFALNGVNFSVAPGEFVAILGGNGSGKSTLSKHINALLIPDEGDVVVEGTNTKEERLLYLIRSTAGMVFQNPDDQIVATLVENDVAFGPENLGLNQNELANRVLESLKIVGLQGFELRETHALSGGQKQRVAIAGVLAMHPKVLILDEASAMIDPRGRAGMMRVIKKLHSEGMTIIMVTHFMEEAVQADRVVLMSDGKIVSQGTPQDQLSDAEMMNSLNLEMPFAARLSSELAKKGVPVTLQISESNLEEQICNLFSTK